MMTPEDIDQILSSDDTLEPTSGFVSNVMHRVRNAADEPAPQTFPWLRFALGLVCCLVVAASGAMLGLRLEQSLIGLCAGITSLSRIEPELAYAFAGVIVGFGFISYQKLRTPLSL
jgi:hypothetical protein